MIFFRIDENVQVSQFSVDRLSAIREASNQFYAWNHKLAKFHAIPRMEQ